MKRSYVAVGGFIILFSVFSIFTFKDSLTPYVSFAQAKSSNNNSIQIRGMLVANSITQIENGKVLKFMLHDDKGEQVAVHYHGTRPGSFEQSSEIVAIGRYQNGQFNAEKLLVKCPSKYQKLQGGSNTL